MNGDEKLLPNYRQFPGPPPSLSIDSLSSSTFSNSSSSSLSSIWSSTFDSKHVFSLSLDDLLLSDRSSIVAEDGTFFGARRWQSSSSSSPSPSSPLDSYSLRRRASTLAAALGLSSPRQFSNSSSSSSSSSNSILSESEVKRRLLAVGAKPNGLIGGKERGRSVGIGTDEGGGGLGKDLGPTRPNRGKSTFGGALVRHFPANGGLIHHSHPWPNPNYSNSFRALLANNARSLPALFGVAIDFGKTLGFKGTTKHSSKLMAGEGGDELVRKRSFSRKSMLVPDRVPAGRRRSSTIVPRRTRPNLQAKIVASKKAIQLQKKQKQMEGQQKQQQIQQKPVATQKAARMPKSSPQKLENQRINVDWTHVPRLKLKFLDKKKNAGKERKKVAMNERIGQEMKVIGGKSSSTVDGNGKKQESKGILQIKGKILENGNKIGGIMTKQMNSSAERKSPKVNQKVAMVEKWNEKRKMNMAWRQFEPLIQPLDRTRMGKSRALKPILMPKSPPPKGVRNPPMNKQFLTGKAPDLFSKPIFLDSPKSMRNFGGIRLGN